MSDDAGAKLLAAVESLVLEIRGLREDRRRDGDVSSAELIDLRQKAGELASLRQSAAIRRDRSRKKLQVGRDGDVPRDVPETCPVHVVKALDLDQEQELELKIAKRRDGDVSKGLRQQTWGFYSEAYLKRYGADPTRNAKVNGQIKQIVERLGAEAPEVAAFFVNHPGAWYATKGHAVGLLLADAEKLRTEWFTQTPITAAGARVAEQSAENFGSWAKHLKGAG